MEQATVAGIWRYPVKSLQGERLERTRVDEAGVEGDRRWAVRDADTGKTVTGYHDARLLAAAAWLQGTEVRVRLPDGTEVEEGERADRALSAWLGRPLRLVRAAPGRAFADDGALHLVTTASLASAAAAGAGDGDARRFRPSLLLETAEGGYPEDGWEGLALGVGSTTLRVFKPTVRCRVITRAQPGVEPDPALLRRLTQVHKTVMGVYAEVLRAGTVGVGDALAPPTPA